MGKWKIYTPDGVQDVLFEYAYIKKELENKFRNLYRKCGFDEIETPTVEFYDVFSAEKDLIPQENMFKFFDEQGRILVLRPDMTIPAARVAATKQKGKAFPLKFSYIGNAFAYNESGGGRQREYTQAGVEIFGVSSPEADAEIIATAIKAVLEAGIEDFQIDIGQVEFFKGLMEETGLSDEKSEQIRKLIDKKDFVGVEQLVNSHSIREELKGLIFNLPKLFGSIDVIEKVEKININKRSYEALENLRAVLSILEDYGYSKYVSVDLGMVQSLNYYTGIIFKGFTYGVGFPILSGGRYDRLTENYGMSCSATGFSLGVNMIMMALERQKLYMSVPKVETLICYEVNARKIAFEYTDKLRGEGKLVEISLFADDINKATAYANGKGIKQLLVIKQDSIQEISVD